jgi:SAM-dependent methyltransferase
MKYMYSENVFKDVQFFCKAVLSNQLAKFAPKMYVNMTHQTGRGSREKDPQEVADYFIKCFNEYHEFLNLTEQEFGQYLMGTSVMEYGPGDVLGAALLFYAYGAAHVQCVDKFELLNLSKFNIEVYQLILNSLKGDIKKRANEAFNSYGKPGSGINNECISYEVAKDGIADKTGKYDLIVSRAVLQHVNKLDATFQYIKRSMKNNGISIHVVDLRSLGLDRHTDLDFLTWPRFFYQLMYSHKGFPNRWRLNKYKQLSKESNLKIKKFTPLGEFDKKRIEIIHEKLSPELTPLTIEDLCWKGFWVHLEHK